MAFSNQNNHFKSNLIANDEIKEEIKKTYYSNLSVSECLELGENSMVIYDKQNLLEELREYIELTNDIPQVRYHTITQVGKIELPNKIELVISGCFEEGLDWNKVNDICIKEGIRFTNQSFGTFISQIRDKYFMTNRIKLTKAQKKSIKSEQEEKCNICSELLEKTFHIDHIKPLSSGGTNDRTNLQALCIPCHHNKTRDEKDTCEHIQVDALLSAFNIETMKLINSIMFRKVAFTQSLNDEEYFLEKRCLDMIKCRKNVLLHFGEDYPRYSVLDDVEAFDGIITTGFYYIESENTFPLRKNGFYSKPMVDFCLLKNIITLDDIKYQFKSSFKIESEQFGGFVSHLLDVFNESPQMQKLSVNSLIGLFGRRKNTFVESRLCNKDEVDDIACAYQDFAKPYLNDINDDVVGITGQSEIKKIESYFPIHAQVLDCEGIELYKLVEFIKDAGHYPYAVKTDAVLYYTNPRYGEVDISNEFWDAEKTIPKYKYDDVKELVREVIVNNEENYELQQHYYKNVEENDDFNVVVDSIINSEKGCLILGSAGCGKTHLTNMIVSALESRSLQVQKLATTNKASLLINGITLDKFSYSILRNKASNKIKQINYLIVDECSMMREIFYQVLLMIKHHNPSMKIIIVGDFGQLDPVNDRVKKNYELTRALFELVDENKIVLTKCKRSDDVLFNICNDVRNGVAIELGLFPYTEPTYLNLCHTNSTRRTLNDSCMRRFIKETKPSKTMSFTKLIYDKNSQDITIAKGMPIIARVNRKSLEIANNECFTIDAVNDDTITISNEMKSRVAIPVCDFIKTFNLAFCITIHKSQGATFNQKYTIYEWSDRMSDKLKYVAISRSSDISNIQIRV
jgi:5-methylcytosine-specific restriction endonuclease McrA/DNA replication protein DnaC